MKIKSLYSLLLSGLVVASTSALAAPNVVSDVAPADVGLAHKPSIIKSLIKRGELDANASEEAQQQAFNQYIAKAVKNTNHGVIAAPNIEGARIITPKMRKSMPESTQQNNTTVKVLTVLVDFPDLPYDDNRLTSSDTGMFYPDYNVQHYQDLMFKTDGYAGPSGQTLKTAYQYYQEESGGSLFFTGNVFGWVTASKNAAEYGAEEGDSNDKDPRSLILEAVTKAVSEQGVNLADYDIEDQYDLDGDGNTNEPDGIVDHIMIFHSSKGQEAGGGVLGSDAIWSHRWSMSGVTDVAGSSTKIFGYTIQPIDAAIGVVVHEFGHDLGVPDEYNTNNSGLGSPVSNYSTMASGSWAGDIPGDSPVAMSPYVRSYFQGRYGGNWVNEMVYDLADIGSNTTIDLVEAVNHESGVNQIRVNVPSVGDEEFPPYAGSYQYYSDFGDNMTTSMSFDTTLPSASSVVMSMKAHWDTEVDYDYVQVTVDGTAIAGNHTSATNPRHAGVAHTISGNSRNIAGAEGTSGWVDLTFDLTAYAGQSVSIEFKYVTDANTAGVGVPYDDGIAIDNLVITGDSVVYSDDAETDGKMTLAGFKRKGALTSAGQKHYWIQLRSFANGDEGLNKENMNSGVLMWFGDDGFTNNKVDDHPGEGFVLVIDADQTRMTGSNNSSIQIKDAPFGLNTQRTYSRDTKTDPIPMFDDADAASYAVPSNPQNGVKLDTLGFKMEVTAQAANSSTATLKLSGPGAAELSADFSSSINYQTVNFTASTTGGAGGNTYSWDFGDGNSSTEMSPSHTYAAAGSYDVTLSVTDSDSTVVMAQESITIAEVLSADFTMTQTAAMLSVSATATGGSSLSYAWTFGDGSTATGATASHTYVASGTFDVVLTVMSSDQQEEVVTKSTTVSIPPAAGFTTAIDFLDVDFSNTTTGGDGALTYAWDFGDGNSSTDADPMHTYAADGTYTVELTVTDANSNVDTFSASVTVAAPEAVEASFTTSISNLRVVFSNTSTGGYPALTYAWDFGDSSTSTQTSPTHTYSSAGTYTVTLTTTDARGNESESTSTVTVAAPVTPPSSGGGGGGGSTSLFGLLLLSVFAARRRKVKA